MADETFDPFRVLAALRAHGVRYVLVGGLAAAAHGSPANTDDVDICLDGAEANLRRLGLALDDLGATQHPVEHGQEHRVSFGTVAGQLDCLEPPPGSPGYADLAGRAIDMDLGDGVHAPVASVEDLAELKRSAGDLAGAAHVVALRGLEVELPEPVAVSVAPTADLRRDRDLPSAELVAELRQSTNPLDVREYAEPAPERRRDKIWKKLEDVDRFMTRLTEGKPPDL